MAEKKAELVKQEPMAMEAIPDFIEQGSREGMEHLTREDIQMPRMGLAQQMSPELVETDAKYIEGLKIGEMFNNLTQRIYGPGPLEFCVIRMDPPRYIEFTPDGKGIIDPNVPHDDPRTKFGPPTPQAPAGTKPVATKFYDFIIMLLPSRELIVLSFKSTGLKVAKQLNGLITFRGATKLFAGKYLLGTVMTQNTKGRFAQFTVRNAGWLPDKGTYDFASQAFEELKNKVVTIEHDTTHEDPDAFDPGKYEAQAETPGGM